jgi:hypothetical protein
MNLPTPCPSKEGSRTGRACPSVSLLGGVRGEFKGSTKRELSFRKNLSPFKAERKNSIAAELFAFFEFFRGDPPHSPPGRGMGFRVVRVFRG